MNFSIQSLVQNLLSVIFPPTRDALLVGSLTKPICATLFDIHRYKNITALCHFRDPRVSALVHEAKFHGNSHAQTLLGSLLAKYLATLNKETTVLIIPIPLSRQRFRERGYNQVEKIAKAGVEEYPHVRMHTDVLLRVRNTTPQTKLSKDVRLSNLDNAFAVSRPETIRNAHLLVIDDVTTTGATLRAAEAALLPHSPASVTLIALAH